MKIVQGMLFVSLVAAAAFRFGAEASVREAERDLRDVTRAVAEVSRDLAGTRLDVEVLESASRLSALNTQHLRLRTVKADQLVDGQDFAEIVGVSAPPPQRVVAPDADVIGNAISMADVRVAAKVAGQSGASE